MSVVQFYYVGSYLIFMEEMGMENMILLILLFKIKNIISTYVSFNHYKSIFCQTL